MWYFVFVCETSHCVTGQNLGLPLLTEIFMENYYTNELHLNQGCVHKKVHVTPHISFPYSPLSCDMWYFVCVCETSHCVHGENLGLPLLTEIFMENYYTNEHLNQGCVHKKVHVTPHISFPYSPLSCDMWCFVWVCETSHCVNGREL